MLTGSGFGLRVARGAGMWVEGLPVWAVGYGSGLRTWFGRRAGTGGVREFECGLGLGCRTSCEWAPAGGAGTWIASDCAFGCGSLIARKITI